MIDTVFFRQAELLLRIIPLIDREAVFALKGGTAINFFVRDLPRISVDIDLVYLPIDERDVALHEISDALTRISQAVLSPGYTLGFLEQGQGETSPKSRKISKSACWINGHTDMEKPVTSCR
ncbi:MAG: nucleotidyl transferase AbiEii/AbiGii toxin family protein [Thermodesulfobacteriota bacterium]|nr:nucleotidyl transferase AbiEii/AbiGii toxin family protein [Thermodesulfobacteriota bacterium]